MLIFFAQGIQFSPPSTQSIQQIARSGSSLPSFTGKSKKEIPKAYNSWADVLQLLPIPLRDDDTVTIKCYIEHQQADTAAALVRLEDPYIMTAVYYASFLSCISVDQFAKGEKFLALYDKTGAALRKRYTRKFDVGAAPPPE